MNSGSATPRRCRTAAAKSSSSSAARTRSRSDEMFDLAPRDMSPRVQVREVPRRDLTKHDVAIVFDPTRLARSRSRSLLWFEVVEEAIRELTSLLVVDVVQEKVKEEEVADHRVAVNAAVGGIRLADRLGVAQLDRLRCGLGRGAPVLDSRPKEDRRWPAALPAARLEANVNGIGSASPKRAASSAVRSRHVASSINLAAPGLQRHPWASSRSLPCGRSGGDPYEITRPR